MSASVSIPLVETQNPRLNVLRLVPGILLLAGIGYAGKVIEKSVNTYGKTHHLIFPNIEYVLWAILIGLLISNLLTIRKCSCRELQRTNSGSKSALCCWEPALF